MRTMLDVHKRLLNIEHSIQLSHALGSNDDEVKAMRLEASILRRFMLSVWLSPLMRLTERDEASPVKISDVDRYLYEEKARGVIE